ncbi:MAG: hypothetical protein ACLFNM_01625 [Candidatus Woesearchaeota archaeon]
MAELRNIIEGRSFSYEGLISVRQVYQEMRNWLEKQDYHPFEENHVEQQFETGKDIKLVIKGDKELSDTAKIKWKSTISFSNLQPVQVKRHGQMYDVYKGKVSIKTTIRLQTDYDKTMDQNAFIYFIKVVIDKFVFKSYIHRAVNRIYKQYGEFEQTIKSYLNMEKF